MYAKIVSTQWGFGEPAGSMIEGCDQWFNHEPNCPMQRSLAGRETCDCYVSRLRLVETPMGEQLATPEPDPNTYIEFWHNEFLAENKRCRQLGVALAIVSGYGLLYSILRITGVWG